MKKSILALIAACLGCCALIAIFPAIAGLSLFGLTALSMENLLCALPLAALGGLAIFMLVKHLRRPRSCATDKRCDCK